MPKASIIFNHIELENMINTKPIEELKRYLDDMQTSLRKHLGIGANILTNSNLLFTNLYGDQFAFMIHKDKITVWDHRGFTSIGSYSPYEFKELLKDTELWSMGKSRCSDCREVTDGDKNPRRYFAGIYCLDCWEGNTGDHHGRGGWKAVESRETYD